MNDTMSLRVKKEKTFEDVETLAKMNKFSNALVSVDYRTGQDRTGQDRARQGRAGQDRTGHI